MDADTSIPQEFAVKFTGGKLNVFIQVPGNTRTMAKPQGLYHPKEIHQRYRSLVDSSIAARRNPQEREARINDALALHADATHTSKHNGEELSQLIITLEKNFPRLVGIQPHEFKARLIAYHTQQEEAVTPETPQLEYSLSYFQQAITSSEHAAAESTVSLDGTLSIYQKVVSLKAEFETWRSQQKFKPGQAKKARQLSTRIEQGILPRLENMAAYGTPPNCVWAFECQSDKEAEPYLSGLLNESTQEERADSSYLTDTSNPCHPKWIIFLNNREGAHRNIATIQEKIVEEALRRGEYGSAKIPVLDCSDFEDRFKGQGDFLAAYHHSLINYLREPIFSEKTGYSKLLIIGMSSIGAKESTTLGLAALPHGCISGADGISYALMLRQQHRSVLQPPVNLIAVMRSLEARKPSPR